VEPICRASWPLRGTFPTTGPAFANASPPLVTKTSPVAWTEVKSSAVNWTGIYLGLNAGFSFGGSEWTDSVTSTSTGNFGTSGFVFGGTVGANYQIGSLVFGVEADGDWADTSGFATVTATSLCTGGCLTQNTWLSTVRGRAGYAFDRFLVYGTGGAAFGNVRANFSNDPVSSATEAGWAAGAGVEVALARNWTAKAEYLFVKLADGSCTTDCAIADASGTPVIPNVAVKFSESLVRGGINYKFAW
jgi:outer membrane immunogenic protein